MHLYLIIINTQPSNLRIWGHIMYKERHTFFEQHFMRMYIMIVMIEKTKFTTTNESRSIEQEHLRNVDAGKLGSK